MSLDDQLELLADRVAVEFNNLRDGLAGAFLTGHGPPEAKALSATTATSGEGYVESLDVPVPPDVAEGDELVLFAVNDQLITVTTPPDGFTLIDQANVGGDGITAGAVWRHRVGNLSTDPEPAHYTITPDEATVMCAAMVRCSGVATSSALRDHSVTVSPDSAENSPTPDPLPSAFGSDLVIIGYGFGDRDGHSDGATLDGAPLPWSDRASTETLHADDWNCALLVSDANAGESAGSVSASHAGSWIVLSVALASAQEVGNDGDTYLDLDNLAIYGPKAGGIWGPGRSLVGPAGTSPGVHVPDAAGDGITDDTAALQAAINEFGSISLPGGRYLYSEALYCPDQWREKFAIVGESTGQTQLIYTGTGPGIIFDPSDTPSGDTRRNFWRLANFTLTGPGSGETDTVGIWANNACAGSINDVAVFGYDIGAKFDGLDLANDAACYYNSITNLAVNDCGSVAVHFAGQANSNTMFGGQANGSETGVKIDPVTNNVTLFGVSIESNTGTAAVEIAGFGNHLIGCRHENPDATYELYFDDALGGDAGTQNVVIGYWSSPGQIDEYTHWDAEHKNYILVPGYAGESTGGGGPISLDDLPAHASTHATGGTDALAPSDIGAAEATHTHAESDIDSLASDLTAIGDSLDGKQTLSTDLTAIAAMSPTNDDVLQRKAGAWSHRTPAQLKTDLSLAKADVGLSNVDNTADTSKPVSTAQQTALDGKAASVHTHAASDVTSGTIAIARIPTGTTSTTVPLGNDSRFSDARTPTSHTHPESDVTSLVADLAGKASTSHTHTQPLIPYPPITGPGTTGTVTIDATAGPVQNIAATGNITLGISTSGVSDGQEVLVLVYCASTGRTITLNGAIEGTVGPTQDISAGAVGFFKFYYHAGLGAWVNTAYQASA